MSFYEKKNWDRQWVDGIHGRINQTAPLWVRHDQKQTIRPAALSMSRWKFSGSIGRVIRRHINA